MPTLSYEYTSQFDKAWYAVQAEQAVRKIYSYSALFVGNTTYDAIIITLCPFQTLQDIVWFLRDGGKASVKTDDVDEAAG